MKKILLLIVLLFGFNCLGFSADYRISTIYDGMILKCTGAKLDGKLKEYGSNVIDFYTVKDGKIYSKNLVNVFKYGNGKERKVKKLKIDANQISFKEKIRTGNSKVIKWSEISRENGEYIFKAKRKFNTPPISKSAYVEGECIIVDKIEY